MGSSANVRTVLSESWRRQPISCRARNRFLTQNGHSRSFKVIYFGITEEPLIGYIANYTKYGLRCEGSKYIYSERKKRKSQFSTTPLSFDAPSPANPLEYPHKTYLARNSDPWAKFLPPIVWVYLHSNFSVWLRNTCL